MCRSYNSNCKDHTIKIDQKILITVLKNYEDHTIRIAKTLL